MKTFQKIILASAISAAPFASQAMEALDDTVLGNTTGQAGVTIEIDIADTGVTIGEIEYIDTAGSADGDGGSVLLQNIKITNADITQTIDVKDNGSLVLGTTAIKDLTVTLGNVDGLTPGSSALALKGSGGTTEVINGVSLVMDMGESSVTLVNLADPTNAATYAINQSFDNGVDIASSAATGSLAIKVEQNVLITDLDVQLFGYTQAQATAKVTNYAGIITSTDPTVTAEQKADALALYNQAAVGAGGAATADAASFDGSQNAFAVGGTAGGSAIKVNDVKFYSSLDSTKGVDVKQTIWAQGGSIANGGGVYIAMGDMKGTLDIGGIVMGGDQSIGQLKISNIDLSGMTQRIYGH